jgi:hypothetical protein
MNAPTRVCSVESIIVAKQPDQRRKETGEGKDFIAYLSSSSSSSSSSITSRLGPTGPFRDSY